jgi:hypothetical protein
MSAQVVSYLLNFRGIRFLVNFQRRQLWGQELKPENRYPTWILDTGQFSVY